MTKDYTLTDFDFALPKSLIAQTPASPRDHARLLIYDRKTRTITDDYFYNLNKHLQVNSALVLNDSKVEKARMRLGNIEIFIVETINPTTIKALVFPGKKFKIGDMQVGEFSFRVAHIDDEGVRTIHLDRNIDDKSFDKYRLTPLPPYIAQNEKLAQEYQTVYADPLGSKAAPTAGLHFTKNLLRQVSKNHDVIKVTLHVGLGTFAPVKTENIKTHILHSENYYICAEEAAKLNRQLHITAVGTTSARVLESVTKPFHEIASSTEIFITPGYKFREVDSLITNFHLPKSSLLMLVSAFLGSVSELHRVYAHAIKNGYRFYSFGDAMLIL